MPTDGDDAHVPAEDAEEILDIAVELAADDARAETERVPVSELERAAAEVGVSPDAVARAVQEHSQRRLLRVVSVLVCVALLGCAGLFGLAQLVVAPSESVDRSPPSPVAVPVAEPADGPPVVVQPPPVAQSVEPVAPPVASLDAPAPDVVSETDPPAEEPAPQVPPAGIAGEPLSGEAAGLAQRALTGSWQLVGWVAASGEAIEVPASARAATEVSAEVWHLLAGGRFRRTIGDDFASSGRWSAWSKANPPARLAWLGVDSWWLVALDQVRISAIPDKVRPREWALVGQDGDERLFFYLGETPELSPKAMGARCVLGADERQRP